MWLSLHFQAVYNGDKQTTGAGAASKLKGDWMSLELIIAMPQSLFLSSSYWCFFSYFKHVSIFRI